MARRFEQCSTGLGETGHVLLGHEDGERISNHRPSIDPEQCLGAQTKQATVRLRCQNGILRIEVLDQGCGFESLYAATSWLRMNATSTKFGLISIRKRMKALGGSFDIQSVGGKGTTAILILPLVHQDRIS